MDTIFQAPAWHHTPLSDLAADADVDVEEASRKRARIEARRKFRIVASTILAAGRFRFVLDVEAEQSEQAQSEIIAAFEALEVQSSSEEMVDRSITRNQRLAYSSAGGELISEPNSTSSGSFPITNQIHYTTGLGVSGGVELISEPNSTNIGSFHITNQIHCTTGLGVSGGGELASEPNSTNIGSFPITNQGYCTTGLGDGTALSDDLFNGPLSINEWSKEVEAWSLPSLEMFPEPEECPADEDSLLSAAGFVWEGNNVMQSLPETVLSDLSISDYLLSLDSQEEKEKPTSSTQGRMLTNEDDDVRESGRHEQERQESSEESLQNLWRIEDNSEDWGTLVTQVNERITKEFQDLESGSGRDKVHKLGEDAREITKKIVPPGLTSEGNRFRNIEARATPNISPTIRDTELRLSDIFNKLEGLLQDLSQTVHGRQKQLAQSMFRLIKDGRKELQIQGRLTNVVSLKLNTLVKELDFRELTVEKHFNKCAASITNLVKLALEKEKKNFTSVASVRKWYFDERSSRQSLPEFSSTSDFYPFLPLA